MPVIPAMWEVETEDRRIPSSRLAQAKLARPVSKTKYKQNGWGYGSVGRALVKHV
jgi:hypothetical protein